jgi:hypothetical protein
MRAGDDVRDDFGILRIWYRRFEDPDNRSGTTAKPNGLADHLRILPESIRPKTISEYHNAGGVGALVFRADEPPEDRVEAHNVEVRTVDDARLNFARLTQTDHGETDGREIAERVKSLNVVANILDFSHGKRCVVLAEASGALPYVDQPVFVAVDERLEEHAAH